MKAHPTFGEEWAVKVILSMGGLPYRPGLELSFSHLVRVLGLNGHDLLRSERLVACQGSSLIGR